MSMAIHSDPTMHSLSIETGAIGALSVASATGDEFCTAHGIAGIGILKVDTEGHDLEVLLGFDDALRRASVDVVQVEASMHRSNERHVHWSRFDSFLEPLGYRLFGVYDQFSEYAFGAINLRRSNLVYVSQPFQRTHAPSPR